MGWYNSIKRCGYIMTYTLLKELIKLGYGKSGKDLKWARDNYDLIQQQENKEV